MNIEYKIFDDNILKQIVDDGGGWVKECIDSRNDVFTLAAVDGDVVVGFICVTPRGLDYPLEHLKDAYIEVYDVSENYRRQGIGRHLVTCAEDWSRENGFRQIRTHQVVKPKTGKFALLVFGLYNESMRKFLSYPSTKINNC